MKNSRGFLEVGENKPLLIAIVICWLFFPQTCERWRRHTLLQFWCAGMARLEMCI